MMRQRRSLADVDNPGCYGGRQQESNRAQKCLFPWCFVKFASAMPPILPLAAVRLLLACGRQRLERGSTGIAVSH